MATVVLPRSLIALFPGIERRHEVAGATVAEVIEGLDARVPGIRNRLVDSGPILREHLNVFVAGERAGLSTPVPAGAIVHVIPAVSGGSAGGRGVRSGDARVRARPRRWRSWRACRPRT